MHIHLDLVGGIAGDMFTAAILDALPELKRPLFTALEIVKKQTQAKYWVEDAMDKGLSGKRFFVEADHEHSSEHQPHHHHHHHHEHRSWKQIRQLISELPVDSQVQHNALGIFGLLAEAEAGIHGKHVDDVHFHEVGAWDCIIDILSASWLIVHSNAQSWSCSDVPWGGGTVHCAHGEIPVPAPATLSLLKGFIMNDDGIKGERVTPTGAAVLAWLNPAQRVTRGSIVNVGYGFGKRALADRANLLRATVLETEQPCKTHHESVCVIQFDIDDMTGELLAIAREKIREQHGVLEVTEVIAHGKKNRHISTITVLSHLKHQDATIEFIFNNTSTLGVRYWACQRQVLPRQHHTVTIDSSTYDVKTAVRPDGSVTSKLESDEFEKQDMNFHSQSQIKSLTEKLASDEFTQSKN
ncbi:LarC family nickel insertion protein [Vibrio mediterranei]|uniref:LarC family nickel insertion protein n=1 Tax=Vibrio mediterranei TaxID=689 RepID=UPI004068641A